ncbi:hypothetical protein ACGF0J_02755 [Nonomuraea sp. NPDC047897]|uniref:hypothetical protein n=1 Tax=Nonomuraea sp. NPDC047897 TaxID=3364346 RepID=UPI003721278E
MTIDLTAAAAFMATHARPLDRRRFDLLTHSRTPGRPAGEGGAVRGALAALDGYRNADGGYGWGLEPDLRSPESQPGAAAHAFEVFEDVAPATSAHAVELCDWLDAVSLPDGGLPFALPVTAAAGCAPWWLAADPATSSLQITAVTAAAAHRVAAHDPAVAAHPWLDRATRYCLSAIEAVDEKPHAYVLAFALRFLDAVHGTRPEAAGLAAHLGEHVPSDGRLRVGGGTEEETLHPLDLVFAPGGPSSSLLSPEAVAADLDRLAGMQEPDGGWTVDYATVSPAGALDWRGHATVRALQTLHRFGRL